MAEVYNWRIEIGIRRDLRTIRVRRPYWDKNLAKRQLERSPAWRAAVGPAPEQTVVDRKVDEDTARSMLESKAIDLSPNSRSVIFSLVHSSCTFHDGLYNHHELVSN
jgi:hypothetical protein